MTAARHLPRGRVRPGLIVLLLIAFALALHAVWDHFERRRLVAQIDAVLARGALAGRPLTPVNPAAIRLAAAAMLSVEADQAAWGLAFDRVSSTATQLVPLVTAEATEARRRLLATADPALQLADDAAALPFTSMDDAPDFALRTSGLLQLSRLLAARTIDRALDGDDEAAVRAAIVSLTVRRAITGGFPSASMPVDAVLSRGRPNDASLSAWAAALRQAEDPDSVSRTVEAARARQIANVWRYYYGPSPDAPQHQTLPRRGVLPWLWRPWFSRQFASDLREWAEVVDVARRSPPQRAPVIAELEAKRREAGPRHGLVSGRWFMGMPESGAWSVLLGAARSDTLAYDRAAQAAIAIERFRRAHDERLPATLEVLVPQFVDAVPLDPFTEQPVRYRQRGSGYVVYSVGPDLKDDGGRTDAPPPVQGPGGLPYRPDPPDVGVAVGR